MALVLVYLCGHDKVYAPPELQSSDVRNVRYGKIICGRPGCQAFGVGRLLEARLEDDFENDWEACDLICEVEDELIATTHRMAKALALSKQIPNKLTVMDFRLPDHAQIMHAVLKARDGDSYEAVFDFCLDLPFGHQLIADAKKLIRQKNQPAGWFTALVCLLNRHNNQLQRQVQIVARYLLDITEMQRKGKWEYQTYRHADGIEELAALRRAGPLGARLAAAPIHYDNITAVDRLMEAQQAGLPGPPPELTIVDATLVADRIEEPVPPKSKGKFQPRFAGYRNRMAAAMIARNIRRLPVNQLNGQYKRMEDWRKREEPSLSLMSP